MKPDIAIINHGGRFEVRPFSQAAKQRLRKGVRPKHLAWLDGPYAVEWRDVVEFARGLREAAFRVVVRDATREDWI